MSQSVNLKRHSLLIAARHIVAMMLVALAYSPIYSDSRPVLTWFAIWLGAVLIGLILFGLYALFFTSHAKSRWPSRFYAIAWVMLAIMVSGPWVQRLSDQERLREFRLKERSTNTELNHETPSGPQSNASDAWWEQAPLAKPSPTDGERWWANDKTAK